MWLHKILWSEGDSKSWAPKERADGTDLPECPEGIRGGQSWQREQQIFHSLREILQILVISEAVEHWHISVTKGNQHNGLAVPWPGVDSKWQLVEKDNPTCGVACLLWPHFTLEWGLSSLLGHLPHLGLVDYPLKSSITFLVMLEGAG